MSTTENVHIVNQDRFMTFSLGKEEYAIPLLSVKELLAVSEITPLPFTPAYFLGLMNLRGQVISIIDIRQKLGAKPQAVSSENAIIICDLESGQLGILVDSVNDVITPAVNAVSEAPDLHGRNTDCISSVFRHEDKLILLLDLEKTLSVEDRKTLTGVKKNAA